MAHPLECVHERTKMEAVVTEEVHALWRGIEIFEVLIRQGIGGYELAEQSAQIERKYD